MNKAITLLGMSGAGKTHFSQRLAAWGWGHYSNDFEIARRLDINVRVDDLSALSGFIGQVGDPAQGGLPLDEFRRRQRLYYDAEVGTLKKIKIDTDRFVNDSTGSFCEITDDAVIADVADKTLLVYIETDPNDHTDIIKRAQDYPKPLYFPPAQFDAWLGEYCAAQGVEPDTMAPGGFSAWVFPKLFASRLPKYERLAKDYGVKVRAQDLHACENEQAFLDLVTTEVKEA